MKLNQTIKINKGVKYLSDVINELPKNCIFDKGATGAGGTTIALTESNNTVICVPFTELISNKVNQVISNVDKLYPYQVFGLYGGIKVSDLKEYLESDQEYKKIIVTYDSLPKLMEYINPKEYNLLVDEFHILTQHYLFRDKAVKGVLKNFNKFKTYTFMTATTVKDEYSLVELRDLKVVNAEWEAPTIVEFIPTKCKSIKGTITRIIREQLNGNGNIKDANLHIFCNSVDFIKDMIKQCKLNDENCRVIYGKNNKTKVGIKNGTTSDPVKLINFYTSTVFEGADIYDENAVTMVVSDVTKEHTLLDISTQITQIAGRVRNSKYADKVYHFFNTNKFLDNNFVTSEQFKEKVIGDMENEKLDLDYINKSINRDKLAEGMDYLVYEEDLDKYEVDENRINWEVRNFEILRGVYKTKINVLSEYRSADMVANLGLNLEDDYIKIPLNTDDDVTIAECIKKLDGLNEDDIMYQLALAEIGEIFDWLPEAIVTIGVDKIEELNYHKGNIMKVTERALVKESSEELSYKIIKILNSYKNLRNGEFISSADAKLLLQKVYDELGLNMKAKATDLNNYYVIEQSSKRVDGKKVTGFIMLMSKFN